MVMYSDYFKDEDGSKHPLYKSMEGFLLNQIDMGFYTTESGLYDSVKEFHEDSITGKRERGAPKLPTRSNIKKILQAFEREGKIVKNTEGEYSVTHLGSFDLDDVVLKDER